MQSNSKIEALKSFFLEQIFIVKKSLEEKHQLETATTLNLWRRESNISEQKTKWRLQSTPTKWRLSSTTIKTAMEDGKTITEDLPIAEIFNNYFSNVIRSLCDRHVPTEPGIACSQNAVSTVIHKFRNHPSILSVKKTWRQ